MPPEKQAEVAGEEAGRLGGPGCAGCRVAAGRKQFLCPQHPCLLCCHSGVPSACPSPRRPGSRWLLGFPQSSCAAACVAAYAVHGAAPGDAGFGASHECVICLEAVAVGPASWRTFPCHHGVCARCVDDIVRCVRMHVAVRVHAHVCLSVCTRL